MRRTSTSAVPDRHCSAPVARLVVREQQPQRRERAIGVALGDNAELRRGERVDAAERASEQREVHRRVAGGVHDDHRHRELQIGELQVAQERRAARRTRTQAGRSARCANLAARFILPQLGFSTI